MNFKEDFQQSVDQEIDMVNNCEIIINPKYYGNQTLDNLIELKLKVHNVLNVNK